MKHVAAPLALLAAISSVAAGQESEKPKRPYMPRYGVSLGFEQLLSSRARDAFGNLGINISPGFGAIYRRRGVVISPDFDIFAAQKTVGGVKNRAFHVLIGPSVRYGFLNPLVEEQEEDGSVSRRYRAFVPYAQVTVGLGYADVNVRSTGREEKGFTYGVSFAVGTSLTKNAYLETRLRFMPKIASYDFSTFGVELGVRF